MRYKIHSQNDEKTIIEFTVQSGEETLYKYFTTPTEHWNSSRGDLLMIFKDKLNSDLRKYNESK